MPLHPQAQHDSRLRDGSSSLSGRAHAGSGTRSSGLPQRGHLPLLIEAGRIVCVSSSGGGSPRRPSTIRRDAAGRHPGPPPRLTPRFVWPSRDCRARTRDSPERATNPNLACRVFANSRAVRIPFRVPRNSTFRVPFNLPGTGDFPVPRNREFHVPRNPAVVSTPPQRGTTLRTHRA